MHNRLDTEEKGVKLGSHLLFRDFVLIVSHFYIEPHFMILFENVFDVIIRKTISPANRINRTMSTASPFLYNIDNKEKLQK